MLTPGKINPQKTEIIGNTFHLFIMDIGTRILFDADMSIPIVYGSPGTMTTFIKTLDSVINKITRKQTANKDTFIRLFVYQNSPNGYKIRMPIFQGSIEKISKEIF